MGPEQRLRSSQPRTNSKFSRRRIPRISRDQQLEGIPETSSPIEIKAKPQASQMRLGQRRGRPLQRKGNATFADEPLEATPHKRAISVLTGSGSVPDVAPLTPLTPA